LQLVFVSVASEYLATGQAEQAVSPDSPLNLPAEQAVQSWEPSVALSYPALQIEQSAEEVAPVHSVVLPVLQGVHCELVSASAKFPAGHFLQPLCVPVSEAQEPEVLSELTPPPQAQHTELAEKSSSSNSPQEPGDDS
jgi:hypothetical protein